MYDKWYIKNCRAQLPTLVIPCICSETLEIFHTQYRLTTTCITDSNHEFMFAFFMIIVLLTASQFHHIHGSNIFEAWVMEFPEKSGLDLRVNIDWPCRVRVVVEMSRKGACYAPISNNSCVWINWHTCRILCLFFSKNDMNTSLVGWELGIGYVWLVSSAHGFRSKLVFDRVAYGFQQLHWVWTESYIQICIG